MRTATTLLSRIFGLFWLAFGLNGLFHFAPIPAPPEASAYFMQALERSGYALPMLYGCQVIAGLMLLLGAWQTLALLLLAPVTLNILLYDLVLNPKGLAVGLVIAAIHALLLWRNRAALRPLLQCECASTHANTLRRG